MKLFSKVAVAAAALMMVSVFTGCKTEDSGAGVVAEFKGKCSEMGELTRNIKGQVAAPEVSQTFPDTLLTFYDDDTFELTAEYNNEEGVFLAGTYKGEPDKNGTKTEPNIVKITIKQAFNGTKLEDLKKDMEDEIYIDPNGRFTYNLMGPTYEFTRVE